MALTKIGKEGITGISNSANATAITIDSSERVLMPSQPSFCGTGSWSYDGNYFWKAFATIDHNIGSHWNNTNGVFTCPVAGRYFIGASNHHQTNATYHLWGFAKNGTTFNGWVQSYNGSSSGENNTASMAVINCSANDTLQFQSNASYANAYTGGNYTVVCVYLIG